MGHVMERYRLSDIAGLHSTPRPDDVPCLVDASCPDDAASSVRLRLEASFPWVGSGTASVNIMALGDVGSTMLTGLRLLAGDAVSDIGIYDINRMQMMRLEAEMGQTGAYDGRRMPNVRAIKEEELFDCDVFVFCASKGVPPLGRRGDMRMAQLEANASLISSVGKRAGEYSFKGLIAVVSDPVDPLCSVLLRSSGLKPAQIRGLGLGVMDMRARYFAARSERYAAYFDDGVALGPHGDGIIIANSLSEYDEEISLELTDMVRHANMQIRELGFKPFIAPALSSAALPLISAIRGDWDLGSVYFGSGEKGAFFGCTSRLTRGGQEIKDIELPKPLFFRASKAYSELCSISESCDVI